MRTVLSACLITLVFVLTSSVSIADDKSHRQAIEELFTVLNLAKTMEMSIEQILEVQMQQNVQLAPYRDVMQKFLHKYFSLESLKEELIQLYAADFTEADLKQLIAFYRTPVGQKTIEKLPKLMAQGAQLGMARVQMHQEELRHMIEEEESKQGASR